MRLVLGIVALIAANAHAGNYNAIPRWSMTDPYTMAAMFFDYPAEAAACEHFARQHSRLQGWLFAGIVDCKNISAGANLQVMYSANMASRGFYTVAARVFYCPEGGTLSGSTCVGASDCPGGAARDAAGKCPNSCTALKGQVFSGSMPDTESPVNVCRGGCTGTVVSANNQCKVGTVASICGIWEYTGEQCTEGPNPGNGPTERCPPGQAPGEVNGITVCAPAGPDNPLESWSSSSGPDGKKKQTYTWDDGNNKTSSSSSPGSPPERTGEPSGGGGGGNNTPSPTDCQLFPQSNGCKTINPIDEYCQDHPEATICKQVPDGSTSGSCETFTCTGDVIQCSIARANQAAKCALNPAPSPLSDLGTAIGNGTDPQASTMPWAPANVASVAIPTAFDQTATIGQNCLTDDTIALPYGKTLTLPWSTLCDKLQLMGSIVVAFALVAAARIVGAI